MTYWFMMVDKILMHAPLNKICIRFAWKIFDNLLYYFIIKL